MSVIRTQDIAIIHEDRFSQRREGESGKIITTDLEIGHGLAASLTSGTIQTRIDLIVKTGLQRVYSVAVRGYTIAQLSEVITAYANAELELADELIATLNPSHEW